jgi:histidyl-tRNA synthetase
MSDAKIRAPRGTSDVLGEQVSVRVALESRARAILEGAGYQRIETPAFESTELFSRGVGASTDIVQKEMYTFVDGGGRSLTLRPEGTAPVCRAYVEHGMHKWPQPVKLWYLSSFFRYERAQAGRYRQFWQVGAEALGGEDPALDAESIVLLARLLAEMDVRDVRLRIASLGSTQSRLEYRERLQAHLLAHEAELSEEVRSRIQANPLRAFDSDHEGTSRVVASAPRLREHLSAEDSEHFDQVCELLDVAQVPYEQDDTLVRGLDYYTRTVFEFTAAGLGAQSGVGGGGRYDGLVAELGGPETPGVGWAAGVERIGLAGLGPQEARGAVDLYVGMESLDGPPSRGGLAGSGVGDRALQELRRAGFEILRDARAAGLSAQMEMAWRSHSGRLKQANRLGARFVATVTAERVTLRDMQSGEELELERATVVHAVLRGLRDLA